MVPIVIVDFEVIGDTMGVSLVQFEFWNWGHAGGQAKLQSLIVVRVYRALGVGIRRAPYV